jgi:hypothetical protein
MSDIDPLFSSTSGEQSPFSYIEELLEAGFKRSKWPFRTPASPWRKSRPKGRWENHFRIVMVKRTGLMPLL